MSTYDNTPDNTNGSTDGWTVVSSEEKTRVLNTLTERVEELEDRLSALEGVFSDRVVDKEQAHTRAQQRDAREQLAIGETHTVVVEEAPDGPRAKAISRIGGIVTFVNGDGLSVGDTVEIKLTDVQKTYVHATTVG